MASAYFTLPSFARAKKNREDLEKTNPQEPVLKDEDEKFFDKEMRSGSLSDGAKEAPATKITDDGVEKTLSSEEREEAIEHEDQTVVPDTRPDSSIAHEDGAAYDDEAKKQAAAAARERRDKKKEKGMELPSQEEAEAATTGFNSQAAENVEGEKSAGEKITWASYLPSMRTNRPQSSNTGGEKSAEKETTDQDASSQQSSQTWTQYAASYVPNFPSRTKKPDPDSTPDPVYNEDGTIDQTATAAKQEREVGVLLDNLNLSSINNRVFAFSAETQHLYERFLLCLKDVVNGAPTAYEDMDKLMKEAGPKLEQQWSTMPPFVQTLVKSLPMRLGPEFMAAAAEKPDDQLKTKLAGAREKSAGGAKEGEQKKSKRKIPGLKSLVSEQGAIATLLRNTVTFIQTRFPFLASTTNVVMSLAVFILMFVFWYCHKRGREVRLAREAEEGEQGEAELSSSEGSEVEEMVEELEKADSKEQGGDEKAAVLNQPAPSEVPLPDEKKDNTV